MTDARIMLLAIEIARRFYMTPMRTEDKLNDDYLKRVITEHAAAVLREWKAGKLSA